MHYIIYAVLQQSIKAFLVQGTVLLEHKVPCVMSSSGYEPPVLYCTVFNYHGTVPQLLTFFHL